MLNMFLYYRTQFIIFQREIWHATFLRINVTLSLMHHSNILHNQVWGVFVLGGIYIE